MTRAACGGSLARMTSPFASDDGPLGVLVAGAGVAGLETMVALRGLAHDAVAPTLVAPDGVFSLRALGVYEAFGHAPARRYRVSALARALDAGRRRDALASVDRARREVRLRSGNVVPYDVLVVAVGAIAYPAFDHGVLFDLPRNGEAVEAMLRDVRAGRVDSVAIVVPRRSAWPFPAYELALLLASVRPPQGLAVTLVTPELEPLAAFGPPATEMIRAELDASGIELVCGVTARVPSARILELPHGRRIRAARIVHLPGMAGPRISGLPCDPDGFVRVGADLHVDDDPDVFAIGDGIAGPHKHGGLAVLQADAVAQEIARRAGAAFAPRAYRPALHAVLRTEHGPRYLRAEPPGGGGECVVSDECLWWPPTKVASRWLTPWLAAIEPGVAGQRPAPTD
jgi:sulfide:quinone oxidoreductase